MMSVRSVALVFLLLNIFSLIACAPEVGSDDWCKEMQDQRSGDCSANEAADYGKHCVFKKIK